MIDQFVSNFIRIYTKWISEKWRTKGLGAGNIDGKFQNGGSNQLLILGKKLPKDYTYFGTKKSFHRVIIL